MLTIDQRRRCARLNGHEISLTPQEYRVLHCLGQQPDQVVEKATLLAAMWANGEATTAAPINPMAVDLVIFRLRKKLEEVTAAGGYLETRRGFGYILHNAQIIFAAATQPTAIAAAEPTPPRLMARPLLSDVAETLLDGVEQWATLTQREWDIFMLIGQEEATQLTNQALAQRLVMAENTLKKHLQNLYRKLNVSNRAAAAILSARVQLHLYSEQRLRKGGTVMDLTQQQHQNETIVRAYYQAVAQRDTAVVAPFLADDVIRVGIIFPDEPPKITRGAAQLLARIQRVIDDNGVISMSNLHAQGDTVTCHAQISTDLGRSEGIAPLEEDAEFLLQGGKILSFKVVSTPESAAKIRRAATRKEKADDALPPFPRMV